VLQDRVWKLACLSKAFSDTVIEFVDVDAWITNNLYLQWHRHQFRPVRSDTWL
jgi:hypothetical protein